MDTTIAFAEELEDVALQLSSLNPLVEEPEAVTALVNQVLAEYERLTMAASLYGMDGIAHTAQWLQAMLGGFRDTLPEAILELLQNGQLFNWIELTAIALREPQESSHLAAITTELTQESWPEPIDMDLLGQLLLSLHTCSLNTDSTSEEEQAANFPTPETTTIAPVLAWDTDIHPELLNAYLQETPGQIAEVATLIRLLAHGRVNAEQKRHAARLAHTIKGGSSVVGVKAIAEFTHRLEDVLELNIVPFLSQGLDDTLGQAADCLETLFDHLQEQNHALPNNYQAILQSLADWERRIIEAGPQEEGTEENIADSLVNSLPTFIVPLEISKADDDHDLANKAHSGSNHITVALDTIQQLINLAGELIISNSQLADYTQHLLEYNNQWHQQDEQVRQKLDNLAEAIDQRSLNLSPYTNQRPNRPDLDQLELDAYNHLHSTSSLLTEAVADTRETTRHMQHQLRQISEQVFQQQRLHRQLSETILRTRLVPVRSIEGRLERTVRETCRQTGKEAVIQLEGQNLQIDNSTLQSMLPPLLHMLRNAIDHGIEVPNERIAAGKPQQGTIKVHFEQKGDRIYLTLSDDGKGLDTERIKARALERGLITPNQTLSESELLRLILRPGFTTRTEVSDVSGRGIGMDVVQTAVEELQGSLELTSVPGQGTTIHIQLPLALIAVNALLMKSVGNLVAIPSSNIKQILYMPPAQDAGFVGENWTAVYQNASIPILHLGHLLGWEASWPNLNKGYALLVIETDSKTYGLYIDELLQPREIVVKSLMPWLNIKQGVTGACSLADGTVVPVLDVLRLLRNFEQGAIQLASPIPAAEVLKDQKPAILVVDDSLSNRKSLSLMIERMGYRPITAVDGLDALQQLHKQTIKLIVTDLEMPRMNGLELTQAIRIWPEVRHLPLLMLTSRSTQKHRQLAETAGVDEYLTKPVEYSVLESYLQKWLSTELAA